MLCCAAVLCGAQAVDDKSTVDTENSSTSSVATKSIAFIQCDTDTRPNSFVSVISMRMERSTDRKRKNCKKTSQMKNGKKPPESLVRCEERRKWMQKCAAFRSINFNFFGTVACVCVEKERHDDGTDIAKRTWRSQTNEMFVAGACGSLASYARTLFSVRVDGRWCHRTFHFLYSMVAVITIIIIIGGVLLLLLMMSFRCDGLVVRDWKLSPKRNCVIISTTHRSALHNLNESNKFTRPTGLAWPGHRMQQASRTPFFIIQNIIKFDNFVEISALVCLPARVCVWARESKNTYIFSSRWPSCRHLVRRQVNIHACIWTISELCGNQYSSSSRFAAFKPNEIFGGCTSSMKGPNVPFYVHRSPHTLSLSHSVTHIHLLPNCLAKPINICTETLSQTLWRCLPAVFRVHIAQLHSRSVSPSSVRIECVYSMLVVVDFAFSFLNSNCDCGSLCYTVSSRSRAETKPNHRFQVHVEQVNTQTLQTAQTKNGSEEFDVNRPGENWGNCNTIHALWHSFILNSFDIHDALVMWLWTWKRSHLEFHLFGAFKAWPNKPSEHQIERKKFPPKQSRNQFINHHTTVCVRCAVWAVRSAQLRAERFLIYFFFSLHSTDPRRVIRNYPNYVVGIDLI